MKMFTVAEAAAELGVSPSLVYVLCSRKRIRHQRHGVGRGKIVIPEDALDEYRQRQTVSVEEAAAGGSLPPLKHITLR
jgi:excisionase family DNA binding protein